MGAGYREEKVKFSRWWFQVGKELCQGDTSRGYSLAWKAWLNALTAQGGSAEVAAENALKEIMNIGGSEDMEQAKDNALRIKYLCAHNEVTNPCVYFSGKGDLCRYAKKEGSMLICESAVAQANRCVLEVKRITGSDIFDEVLSAGSDPGTTGNR